MRWSHLLADELDELHAFAARLGIPRRGFESRPGRPWSDHYDVPEWGRERALALGAVPLTRREVVALVRARRAAIRSAARAADDHPPLA